MMQVSLTSIAAFRAVGVLMVLAFITGPPLAARLLTHDLKKMLLYSVLLGTAASLFGVALSRHILSYYGTPLSTGGITVCTIVVLYIGVLFVNLFRLKAGKKPIKNL
jgi:manganese/zinc/iron transport system permease protein